MPIVNAILLYNINNLKLYILEKCDEQITIEQLRIKEDKWRNLINPSYTYRVYILNPFLGKNHYRYGKTVSQETRQKISNT